MSRWSHFEEGSFLDNTSPPKGTDMELKYLKFVTKVDIPGEQRYMLEKTRQELEL